MEKPAHHWPKRPHTMLGMPREIIHLSLFACQSSLPCEIPEELAQSSGHAGSLGLCRSARCLSGIPAGASLPPAPRCSSPQQQGAGLPHHLPGRASLSTEQHPLTGQPGTGADRGNPRGRQGVSPSPLHGRT